jgi:hypothetical protein
MAIEESPDVAGPTEPHEPPPIWDGPLFRGKAVDPNPDPPPVYSRRQGGPTSFGYRGRLVSTIVVVGAYLFFVVLAPPWTGPFALVYAIAGLFMEWLILRSVWKKERVG